MFFILFVPASENIYLFKLYSVALNKELYKITYRKLSNNAFHLFLGENNEILEELTVTN